MSDGPVRALEVVRGRAERDPEAELRRAIAKVVQKSVEVAETAVSLAPEIDDEIEDPPPGWTKRAFRIAKDARKSTSEAPVYLKMASGLAESKAKADKHETIDLNIRHEVVLPSLQSEEELAEMKVIEVTPVDRQLDQSSELDEDV